MSRIALLLLGSALLLIVAACDSNSDDTDTDTSTETETEAPAGDESNDETEATVTEEEGTDGTTTEESSPESESDAESTAESDEVAESGDGEATPSSEDGTAEADGESTGTPEQTPSSGEGTAEPDAEASPSPQQTPPEGMFLDITLEEANEMTDFEVKEPQEVPESVEFQSIMGMASQQASEEERSEKAATIIFSYTQPAADDSQQGLPVELTQSTELDLSASLPPDAEQEQVTIGDREVTRVNLKDQSGNDILAYMWNENEIHYSLAAILGPELNESQLEDMLASIPAS